MSEKYCINVVSNIPIIRKFSGITFASLHCMKHILMNLCFLGCLALWLFGLKTVPVTQAQSASGRADISPLIKRLEDQDERVVYNAVLALVKEGSKVIPLLVETLRERRGCQLQFVASGIIYQLEPQHELINPTLMAIIKGKCKASSLRDLKIRRQAAFALVAKPEGIPVMAEMLRDRDTFIRRSAAFAFDELTERLESQLRELAATPEIIRATKAALPSLVQALNDQDEIVRCMSYESLEQVQGSKHEELRVEASKLIRGVKVRCSK